MIGDKKPVYKYLQSPDKKVIKKFIVDGAGSNGKTRAEFNGFIQSHDDWKEIKVEE